MFDTIADRLTWAMEQAGTTFKEMAAATGVPWKTIQSHASGHRGKRGLPPEIAAAYARTLRIEPFWLMTGAGEPRRAGSPRDIRVSVRGTLQAGAWTDHFEWPESDWYDVWVRPDADVVGETLYAAEVRGTSMNRVYPDGTVVVLRRRIDGARDLIPGKRYHVERTDPDGRVENTLKTVRTRGDGSVWLVPESDDPEFAASIPVTPGADVSFVGRVVRAILRG